ncbi:MAG TPA: response regulator [Planctomycetota bacterium]|nr:response regulator [Planctomycetota bacterium]
MPPGTILIVDDDSLVRWSLTQHLTQQGFRVISAGTAAEARAQARPSPGPQLIVLDLKLPDMDGLALMEALRRDGASCPVIVLSAHLTPELSLKALASGANYVTEKPFQLEVLHELVRRALEAAQPHPI